jgi:hypothetical protein
MSCLTAHNIYGSQGANRTAILNTQTCIDLTDSPVAAVYQVGEFINHKACFKKMMLVIA